MEKRGENPNFFRGSNKAQLTLFIIFGLLILAVLAYFFFVSQSTEEKKYNPQDREALDSGSDVKPIENYVLRCLESTTDQGIFLLGRQGGLIYKSQGGPIVDFREDDEGKLFLKHENFNVGYSIMPLGRQLGKYSNAAGAYPWETYPFESSNNKVMTQKGIFGISGLMPLNSSYGANSFEFQLKTYVLNNFLKCTNWTIFEGQYDIIAEEPKLELFFSQEGANVVLEYPIEITELASGKKTNMKDFYTKSNVRLIRMHRIVSELIEKDNTDMDFNLDSAQPDNKISIGVVNDVSSKDDLVIIRDEGALLNGAAFEYVFARKNRRPALYFIEPNEFTFEDLYNIQEKDILPNGLGNTIAKDPDEDKELTFSIIPSLPRILRLPEMIIQIVVSDGELEDYQNITVFREEIQ